MTEAIKSVRISAAAVWSLILGILSLLYFGIFAGIPAIIGGHTARSEIRQSQGALVGEGLALSGLITGYLSIGLTAFVILYTVNVAVPLYNKNKYYSKDSFSAAITELNGRESLTWADHKTSAAGWVNDAAILLDLDYSLDIHGNDYRWTNGMPSAGGRVLSWKGHEVTLCRKPSTDDEPAVWSRVVEGYQNVKKVPVGIPIPLRDVISELNGRETVTWADHKISAAGWVSDAAILLDVEHKNLDSLGSGYSWTNGMPSTGGRVLSWKGYELTLYRKPSTDDEPAVWSRVGRVVKVDENVKKVPAEFKNRDKINIVLNNTSEIYALLKYRPMDFIWVELFIYTR